MRNVTTKEFESVCALSGASRYDYFVKFVADTEEVWSLRSSEGWVMAATSDGKVCVPVWPHQRYAEACATGEWRREAPVAIPLDAWLERWTLGLEHDERLVAVFPVGQGTGVPVQPARLASDIRTALQAYE